jgi:hypothetical protein
MHMLCSKVWPCRIYHIALIAASIAGGEGLQQQQAQPVMGVSGMCLLLPCRAAGLVCARSSGSIPGIIRMSLCWRVCHSNRGKTAASSIRSGSC